MPTAETPSTDVPPQVVVLVHGIRTQAPWAEMVMHALSDEPTIQKVIPVRYGYFNMFRFLTPVLTRRGPIRLLARELRDIRKQFPDARLTIIAHSFGTYATAQVLDDATDIEIDRLILCGSIIPQDFRWDKVADQVRHEILNDCGTRDIWPVMAKFMTWGFGPSGTFGFGKSRVRDRFHNFQHSDFFDRAFVERFWVPYLVDGTIAHSDWELERPTPPWWQSLLSILKLPVLLLLFAAGMAGWMWYAPLVESRDYRGVCVAPAPLLWERLPVVGGNVASPLSMEIRIDGRAMAVDTLRQRIYCVGTNRDAVERRLAALPDAERFEALRTYMRTLTDDEGVVEQLYTRLTAPAPAILEATDLSEGSTLEIRVRRQSGEELNPPFRLTTTVGEDALATEIIQQP